MYTSVAMPCFVSGNADRALALLGGKEAVASALEHDKGYLKLQFSADPLRQYLVGRREASSGFVLSLVRQRSRKDIEENTPGAMTVKVVGSILDSYQFRSLADFQFLPERVGLCAQDSASGSTSSSSSSSGALHMSSRVIEAIPRPFTKLSRQDKEQKEFPHWTAIAGITSAASSDDRKAVSRHLSSLPQKSALKKAASKLSTAAVELAAAADGAGSGPQATPGAADDASISTSTSISTLARTAKDSMRSQLLIKSGDPIPQKGAPLPQEKSMGRLIHFLNELFTRRPGWLRKQLEGNPEVKRRLVSTYQTGSRSVQGNIVDALVVLGFNFITGPHKDLWVRYGYNPAEHPETRHLQMFYVRMRRKEVMLLNSKLLAHIGTQSINHVVNLDDMTLDPIEDGDLDMPQLPDTVNVLLFGTLIRTQFALQVCSMADTDILHFVSKALRLQAFDNTTGWYSQEFIELLRLRVVQTIFERVERLVAEPIKKSKGRKGGAKVPASTSSSSSSLSSAATASAPATSVTPAAAVDADDNESVRTVTTTATTATTASAWQDLSGASAAELGFDEVYFSWQEMYASLADNVGGPAEQAINKQELLLLLSPEYREMHAKKNNKAQAQGGSGAKRPRPSSDKDKYSRTKQARIDAEVAESLRHLGAVQAFDAFNDDETSDSEYDYDSDDG